MNSTARLIVFTISGVVFGAIFVAALAGLHPFGQAAGLPAETYGNLINALTVPERHITDAITAVNFDFRGFDTLGEEYIMFASVMGVVLLLRKAPDERDGPPVDRAKGRTLIVPSSAVRTLSVTLISPVVLFGIYIVAHGQLTPGGGFQGGVILAAAPLLIYLAGEFETLCRLCPRWLLEVGEALGAGGYAVTGAISMFSLLPFLTNSLPLGKTGDVFSGGMVALIDLAVGLEVAGGFILLLLAFLEGTLVRRASP